MRHIKFVGTPSADTVEAIDHAKKYKGTVPKTEFRSNCIIKYSGDTAIIIPMLSYSKSNVMPNPVPYRGVSIGLVAVGGATSTYVAASDGTVLASEVLNSGIVGGHQHDRYVTEPDSGAWNGGPSVWMFDRDYSVGSSYSHTLIFTVPEDCIYPPPIANTSYPGSDGLTAQWNADWAAGVTAFNARRKAWFKKNSDTFIASLKAGFALPARWDYALKTGATVTGKTYRPILMTATYPTDVVVGAGNTATVTRVVTFSYVDASGNTQQQVVTGTWTLVVTGGYTGPVYTVTEQQDTFVNWYATVDPSVNSKGNSAYEFVFEDFSSGEGLLWNGVVVNANAYGIPLRLSNKTDSTWGWPENPLDKIGYSPAIPPYSNTLVGTAPQFVINYHNTVLPKYDATGALASKNWNDSTLYGVSSVNLRLFGPVAADGTLLGIFAAPADADGCTSIAYYGKATFAFDWKTGAFTFSSWAPQTDKNGNLAPKIVPLPAGVSYTSGASFTGVHNPDGTAHADVAAYNNVISYNYIAAAPWPDVALAARTARTNAEATLAYLTNGTVSTTAHFGDPIQALVSSL